MGGGHCVPIVCMNTSHSLCPPGRAALSLRLEQLPLSRSCCALVSWAVQLGGLRLGQVRLSWVIPAGPVSGWLLGVAVFWPCQLVRHVLQQGHEWGAPPLTGKKNHSVLCDSPEMQVTATGVRFGNWSFPGLCPDCGRPKGNRKVCEFLRVTPFPGGASQRKQREGAGLQ